MKNHLIKALARLASSSYQEAFLVAGNRDEYVIPEDLVEDAASLCRLAQRPGFATQFESSQLGALAATLEVIGEHGRRLFGEAVVTSRAALVRDDPDWSAMRSAAIDCLATFGIDAAALQVNDIDGESSP